ncbi:DEAD/DEAH box helicase [Agromyces sp. NPDC058484]|uniref:DEAD/DEAH box helicase n=1 Tax=Agromyces sp. NPDC058484 TaxID=3346524 RepID=UPI003647DEA3
MPVGIRDVLDHIRDSAIDKRDQGTRFEWLMRSYLTTDPTYADTYSDVWMWSDYPGRNGRKDEGIDLVARDALTGELTAIQCKFYDEGTYLTKPHLDGFVSASAKTGEFASRMFISTTDKWNQAAEAHAEDLGITRIRVQDLDQSPIDWGAHITIEIPETGLSLKAKKQPRPHQLEAIAAVEQGFATHDRGKLIMACGTGKTFTSLKLAERIVPNGGTALFLVPSIALLSQSLKEWKAESEVPIRAFAVCSDVSVGKRKAGAKGAKGGNAGANQSEDLTVIDLAYPATTKADRLAAQFAKIPKHADGIVVVFATYQSIGVAADAQALGVPEFDLIVCDEAHRTTGVTVAGDDESAFVKVHDQRYLAGRKRLYMTATPRIFSDAAAAKADEKNAVLADMNDEPLYGPEFHRLGFGDAVSKGLLTDYKVLVLAVNEAHVSGRFQRLLSDEHNELRLEDAAKIVGCWNGLSKRSLLPEAFAHDPDPMRRAVAFAANIKESQKIAAMFERVVEAEIEALEDEHDASDAAAAASAQYLRCEVEHVDGTFNILRRNEKLDWLKAETEPGTARILTNARCLSEGVDVPALDAVMFLNPRNSQVDVVQSVGRVMRKLEGKNYGYVILPIGVPAEMDAATALDDNEKYRVVWQVLQARRAHDERFDAEVNKLDLTRREESRVQVGVIGKGGTGDERDQNGDNTGDPELDIDWTLTLERYHDAILAKIVEKVGTRKYWETWAKDVAGIATAQITRIRTMVSGSDAALRAQFLVFVKGLQDNLNPAIGERDAIEMLAQHLITRPVFEALFDSYRFTEHNPVAQVMQQMLDALSGADLEREAEQLERFYESVRVRASGIESAEAKQTIVKELYEKFFRTAFAGTSDRLGIVYTPNEIVDFIIRSVDTLLRQEFDSSLSSEGVHVLDPFTGTGTFVVRLLQSALIRPEDLARKYASELHANEIVLLAYYVAAVNIEETFHALVADAAGGPSPEYTPFPGIVLTDTFQMREDDDELDGAGVFPENNERVVAQKARDIRVIIGNPPYSVGQSSGNDDNQNLKYPTLDRRIEQTYAARSSAQNKNSLYDAYIRSIRWASDRIGDEGVVAFVSNGGFIDGNTADGLRMSLVEEFSSLYVFNLRGNQRTAGEQSRREGGKVFGSGSRNTVAISLLVKNPRAARHGQLFYRDIGDYLSREQKLNLLAEAAEVGGVEWTELTPNAHGDWINQRSDNFAEFTLLASKDKAQAREPRFLTTFSAGLKTNRDYWVNNFSRDELDRNVRRMVDFYNSEVDRAQREGDAFTRDNDPRRISWNRADQTRLARRKKLSFDAERRFVGTYRPFTREHVYFDATLNDMVYQLDRLFPTAETENWGFYLTAPGAGHPFSLLVVGGIPDLAFWGSGSGQFFPRYSFEPVASDDLLATLDDDGSGYRRLDNVTDEILADYRATFGGDVTKDDIFHYLYGLLHSPEYRDAYAADLKKMLPRIPKVAAFREFTTAGAELAALHRDYEQVEPYPLAIDAAPGASVRVEKMRYAKTGKQVDKTTVVVNPQVTVRGIPAEAQEYLLGSRSALDWVLERYQVKTDKASGIVNDPNAWGDEHGEPRYILDLIGRVTAVSVRTVEIVRGLPSLELVDKEAAA